MPLIKLQHLISFTSEDTKHRAANLLTGNGVWLCSPDEQSTSIKAEFQLQKATTIDFIDIGNYNSSTLCIEVGMSTWPSSQLFAILLPTVVLMTPSDCRSGQNSNTVRMFKKENLDKDNISKKWDRVRVICSQPFKKNSQYGLAFLKLYTHTENVKETTLPLTPEIKKKREAFIMSTATTKNSPNVMSESLKSLEKCRVDPDVNSSQNKYHSSQVITSPLSRAGKLVMSTQHVPNASDERQQKKELECEALNFLISLNLTSEDMHTLKVSHVREEFEGRRGRPLNTREKIIFKNIALDYATKSLSTKNEEKQNGEKLLISSDEEEEDRPSKRGKLDNEGRFIFKRNSSSSSGNTSTVSPLRADGRRESCPSPFGDRNRRRNDLALMDSVVTVSPKSQRGGIIASRSDRVNSRSKSPGRNDRNKTPTSIPPQSEVIFDLGDGFKDCSVRGPSSSTSHTPEGVGHRLGSSPSSHIFKSAKNGIPRDGGSESPQEFVECPLCTELFSSDSIERHAADCDGRSSTDRSPNPAGNDADDTRTEKEKPMGKCPICGICLVIAELQEHADECADKMFSL